MCFGSSLSGKRKWGILVLAFGVLVLLLVYEVLWARLFPFSPVVVGFARHDYEKAIVYHCQQPESDPLSYLDEIIVIAEKYHGMPFRWKPEIFLCRDDAQFHRLSGGRARFIAINGRLFVSQHAQEETRQGIIDLRTYLTHELSHCLLQQYLSTLRYLKMPRWLLEGIAMDCARQVGVGIYPTKAAVYEAVARGMFCEPEDFGTCLQGEKGTARSCPIANKTAFFYSEFGCLVEGIRSTYGAERFQAFLKDVVTGRVFDVERSFEGILGKKLNEEIARFKAETKKR